MEFSKVVGETGNGGNKPVLETLAPNLIWKKNPPL